MGLLVPGVKRGTAAIATATTSPATELESLDGPSAREEQFAQIKMLGAGERLTQVGHPPVQMGLDGARRDILAIARM